MLNTDRQSQVSLLPSAVSCFKCMLVMLTLATNMYTEIHKYTNTYRQTYKCKDRDKTTHTEIQMQRQVYVFSHLAAKYSVMCPAQCWGLADISPEEKAPILKFSETFCFKLLSVCSIFFLHDGFLREALSSMERLQGKYHICF